MVFFGSYAADKSANPSGLFGKNNAFVMSPPPRPTSSTKRVPDFDGELSRTAHAVLVRDNWCVASRAVRVWMARGLDIIMLLLISELPDPNCPITAA